MRTATLPIILVTQLAFGLPAVAQQVSAGTTTSATVTTPVAAPPVAVVTPPPSGVPGSFAALSPGNRAIANALYEAQRGPFRWTRNQIATARLSGEGWGEIFHEMRSDGLVHAKSLGQVIRQDRGHFAERHEDRFRAGDEYRHMASTHHHQITVTTAGGAAHVIGEGGGRHHEATSGAAATAGTRSGVTTAAWSHHAPIAVHSTATVSGLAGGEAAIGPVADMDHDGMAGHGHR